MLWDWILIYRTMLKRDKGPLEDMGLVVPLFEATPGGASVSGS